MRVAWWMLNISHRNIHNECSVVCIINISRNMSLSLDDIKIKAGQGILFSEGITLSWKTDNWCPDIWIGMRFTREICVVGSKCVSLNLLFWILPALTTLCYQDVISARQRLLLSLWHVLLTVLAGSPLRSAIIVWNLLGTDYNCPCYCWSSFLMKSLNTWSIWSQPWIGHLVPNQNLPNTCWRVSQPHHF